MKPSIKGACAAAVLTVSPALVAAGVALALAGCQKGQEAGAAPLAALEPAVPLVAAAASPGDDPLAAARDPARPTGQTQAMDDSQDNARAQAAAPQLLAHADWLARQEALCGPGDAAMQARYAARQGPPDAELRDLKVACLAKDIARQSMTVAQTRHGGVSDTGSL